MNKNFIKDLLIPSPKFVKVEEKVSLLKEPFNIEIFLWKDSLTLVYKTNEFFFPSWPISSLDVDIPLEGPFIVVLSNKRKNEEDISKWVRNFRKYLTNPLGVYVIEIKEHEIFILCDKKESLYWAITTLAQIIEIKKLTKNLYQLLIIDYPSYPFRGIQIDLSRGQVLNVNSIKRWIQWVAGMKGNFLSLYIEPHVIAWDRYPELREGHDVLLKEEIIELDRYAKKYNIQLIPGFQTFSHMERLLSLPKYSHLSERKDEFIMLCPILSESRRILQNFFEELCPLFSSKYFNAGFDECLPFEKSLKRYPDKKPSDIYISHLNWINNQLKKFGKQTMIYADTLWRNYPFILKENPEKEKEIPRDIILLNWEYEPRKDYPSMECFSRLGFKQIILSGALDSRRIFPRIYRGNEGVRRWLENAKEKQGILGLFSTSWGNHYHRNFSENSLYSLMFGLEAGWQGRASKEKEFEKRFCYMFFKFSDLETTKLSTKLFRLLGTIEDKGPSLKFYVPWRDNYRRITHYFLFWLGEDPSHRFDGKRPRVFSLEGDTVGSIKLSECETLEKIGRECLDIISKIKREDNAFLLERMEYVAGEVKWLGLKLKLRKHLARIRREYIKIPSERKIKKEEVKRFLNEYEEFYNDLKLLKDKFINLWKQTSKEIDLKPHISSFEQLLFYHENIIKELKYLLSNWDKEMEFYNM